MGREKGDVPLKRMRGMAGETDEDPGGMVMRTRRWSASESSGIETLLLNSSDLHE